MKKLFQNSIFAKLMDSPWWWSAGIALLLFVGGFVVMPIELAATGLFAALPFIVVAVIALVRQWRNPSSARVEVVTGAVANMSWADFSKMIEAGFQRDGCDVQRLNLPAADFALRKDGHEAIVSAKRWKAARIGIEPLRELRAVCEKRGAREAIFIALGDISDTAMQYARSEGVSLMAAPQLAKLLRNQKFL